MNRSLRAHSFYSLSILSLMTAFTISSISLHAEDEGRGSTFYRQLRARNGRPVPTRAMPDEEEADFGPPEVPRRPRRPGPAGSQNPGAANPSANGPTVVQSPAPSQPPPSQAASPEAPGPAKAEKPTPARERPPVDDGIRLPAPHENRHPPVDRSAPPVAPTVERNPGTKRSPAPPAPSRTGQDDRTTDERPAKKTGKRHGPRRASDPREQKSTRAEEKRIDVRPRPAAENKVASLTPENRAPEKEPESAGEPEEQARPELKTSTRRDFAVRAPAYYRGIYINNAFFRSKHFGTFLKTAAAHGMNALVIDIQPTMPSAEVMKQIHEAGFYTVARVVCFPDGLKTYPATPAQLDRILDRAELGAKAGFAEVQLDYIRFADNLHVKGLTIEKRYRYLSGILSRFEDRLRPYRVRIGGDIFGRIAFNKNDIIGQKLEVFDNHLDTIYPMLYPSHFYGEPFRRRQPYRTVLEGTRDSRHRVKQSRIIPYIQAFTMKVGESGLSLEDYIRSQVDGARDSGGAGYIVWNARNDYQAFFRALQRGRLVKARDVSPGNGKGVDRAPEKKNQTL